jgi:uncharacterized protein YecT (DUF1311 family)
MIVRIVAVVAATVAFCAAAGADPLLTKSQIAKAARDIEACLDKQDDDTKCVGIIEGPCSDAISAGGDAAHATCADNETAAWDVLLNKAWAGLPAVLGNEEFAALKDVQRQWLAYRDAKCAFFKLRDDNVLGLAVAAHCRLDETARRTRELRDILAGL